MSLNREQRRILKKKLGPVAKQVVELEKRLRDLKDQLSDEEKQSMVAGKEIYITFDAKVMHFFDKETEESLLV